MTKSKTHFTFGGIPSKIKVSTNSTHGFARDEQLIRSLVEFFGCGYVYLSRESVNYCAENFADLTEKLYPFTINMLLLVLSF